MNLGFEFLNKSEIKLYATYILASIAKQIFPSDFVIISYIAPFMSQVPFGEVLLKGLLNALSKNPYLFQVELFIFPHLIINRGIESVMSLYGSVLVL